MPLHRRLSGSRSLRYWVIVSLGVCGVSIFHYPPGRGVEVCVCVRGGTKEGGYQCSAVSSDEAVKDEAVKMSLRLIIFKPV